MPLPPQLQGRLSLPLAAAPMFGVSGPQLVIACCRQGVIGTLPAFNRPDSAQLGAWLDEIETALQGQRCAPYGVNLIMHKTNRRLQADLELCCQRRVPLVITSVGFDAAAIAAVHAYGGMVFHDVVSRSQAEKAAGHGVDGVVCLAAGAGGQTGWANPFALVQEVRQVFAGCLLLAGGLNSGHDLAAAQLMGADLGWMGTRFLATQEALADENYKRRVLEAGCEDIVCTAALSGLPANVLRASLAAAGIDPDADPGKVDVTERMLGSGAGLWQHVMSVGHGVGGIVDIPDTATLCTRLRREYATARERLSQAQEDFQDGGRGS